jgi:hypothetical protein
MHFTTAIIVGLTLGLIIILIVNDYERIKRSEKFKSRQNKTNLDLKIIRTELHNLRSIQNPSTKQTAELYLYETVLQDSVNDLDKIKLAIQWLHNFYHQNFPDKNINYKMNYTENSRVVWPPLDYLNIILLLNEAIYNAVMHSCSTFIFSICSLEENKHEFITHDNGIGFNEEEITITGGIARMKKLANSLNASLKISSIEELGTKITLRLPL